MPLASMVVLHVGGGATCSLIKREGINAKRKRLVIKIHASCNRPLTDLCGACRRGSTKNVPAFLHADVLKPPGFHPAFSFGAALVFLGGRPT